MESFQVNNLSWYVKKPEKEEQIKTRPWRSEIIIKIEEDITTWKQENNRKYQSGYLNKLIKIDKALARLTKKKRLKNHRMYSSKSKP